MPVIGGSRMVPAPLDVSANVNSVFGRTGAVVAQSGDYTASQVTGAASKFNPILTSVVGATYTAHSWDLVIIDNDLSAVNVTLPASPSPGDQVGILTAVANSDVTSASLFTANAGQNIFGQTSSGIGQGDPNFGGPVIAKLVYVGTTSVYGAGTWMPEGYSGADLTTTGLTTPASNVAAGSNGGDITTIASWAHPSAGVLALNRNPPAGFLPAGKAWVVTSAGLARISYTGIDTVGHTLTGCALISGSGTVSTGGHVTSGIQLGTGMTLGGPLAIYGSLYLTIPALQNANYVFQPVDLGFRHTTGTHTWTLLGDENGKTVFVVNLGGSLTLVDNAGGTVLGVSSYVVPVGSSLLVQYIGGSWVPVAVPGASDTSYVTTFVNPTTPTLGAAAVVSAVNDQMVYIAVTAAGQLTVTMGPSTGAENAVLNATAVTAGQLVGGILVPKGWKVAVTTSSTATWTALAVPK